MNFIVNESRTKLRGGYYTDKEIALFLTRWIFGINPKKILEPSCGDGVFFEMISHVPHEDLENIVGFEIEKEEVIRAKERGDTFLEIKPDIHHRDFLAWALTRFMSGEYFDGILGNPPYIRYQYLDEKLQSIAEAIFKYHSLKFTKHTNAWVPFVIASLALLRPGGRLGMVLPSELLHVLHAQPLRNFLAHECNQILIIDPNELWFDNTLQGAVLLLTEKKIKKHSSTKGLAIVQTRSKKFLTTDPTEIYAKAEYLNGETIEGKWLRALLTKKERDVLSEVSIRENVFRFNSLADVDVGIVTGANKFFLVNDEIVNRYGLQKWAYPMFGRSEHVEGVIYSKSSHKENQIKGLPTNFIWFTDESLSKLPASVRSYISYGEDEGLDKRYKCRIRDPWFSVPSVYTTPIGMLKRSHNLPRLILNKANAYTTDTAYRIKPKKIASEKLVYSFVNSLTVLSAELEGRHYGGGVLELVPSEIEKLLIPIPSSDKIELMDLNEIFKSRVQTEEILARQDSRILKTIGISNDEINIIFSAWRHLKQRRQRTTNE